MRTRLAKWLHLFVITVLMLGATGSAMAADTINKPFIKTFGSDLMTGGWFKGKNGCANNYQNPEYSNSLDSRTGGILTYTKTQGNSSGGASSQYGALSLGEIDGQRAGDGFYSAGARAGGPVTALSFANTFPVPPSLPFGGKFEGATDQSNCLPDYFSKVDPTNPQVKPLPNSWSPVFNTPSGDGTYYGTQAKGSSLDLFKNDGNNDMKLNAGKRVAIFIDGNVYIDHNIIYDTNATSSQIPKFALIVKGSIYVDPSVTQLDGFYVAQPADDKPTSVSTDTGVFWTCHEQDPAQKFDPYYFPSVCNTPLVVNGAVVAKQLNLLRVIGDVGASGVGEDNLNALDNCKNKPFNGCNVSEIFNYTPAMMMGGSFFDTTTSSSSSQLPIDSVISLPPVF